MDDVLSYIGRQGVFCGDFSAERISAGASGSAVYAVADRCGKYILKASQDTGGKDAHQSSPFAREYAFHTLNRRLKLPFVPKVVYAEKSPLYGYLLVLERLTPITHSDWDEALLRKTADACAQLHSLDANLFADLHLRREPVRIDREATDSAYREWQAVLRRHEGAFQENMLTEIHTHLDVVCPVLNRGSFCICHGDFHPDNIVTDGKRIYIIDWQNISVGKGAGDLSFFLQRSDGFGIPTNSELLFAEYAERLSFYTGRQCDETTLLRESSASALLTIFTFWAYFLKDAPRARVETFFNAMTEAYKCLQTDQV